MGMAVDLFEQTFAANKNVDSDVVTGEPVLIPNLDEGTGAKARLLVNDS